MLQKIFLRVASEILLSGSIPCESQNIARTVLDGLPTACPDQSVGLIGKFDSYQDFSRISLKGDYIGAPDAEGCVVLVLESPHTSEYRTKNGRLIPIGPANGCTGCRIRRYFNSITKGKYDKYEMILVNVIQYPCSLGIGRDMGGVNLKAKILRRLLPLKKSSDEKIPAFEKNFYDRMEEALSLSLRNSVVFACTNLLKERVCNRLRSMNFFMNLVSTCLATCHPSLWNNNTKVNELLID